MGEAKSPRDSAGPIDSHAGSPGSGPLGRGACAESQGRWQVTCSPCRGSDDFSWGTSCSSMGRVCLSGFSQERRGQRPHPQQCCWQRRSRAVRPWAHSGSLFLTLLPLPPPRKFLAPIFHSCPQPHVEFSALIQKMGGAGEEAGVQVVVVLSAGSAGCGGGRVSKQLLADVRWC